MIDRPTNSSRNNGLWRNTLTHIEEEAAAGDAVSRSYATSKLHEIATPVSRSSLSLAILLSMSTSISIMTAYSGLRTTLDRRKNLLSTVGSGGGAELLLLLAPAEEASGKRMTTTISPEIRASFTLELGNIPRNCCLICCSKDLCSNVML